MQGSIIVVRVIPLMIQKERHALLEQVHALGRCCTVHACCDDMSPCVKDDCHMQTCHDEEDGW